MMRKTAVALLLLLPLTAALLCGFFGATQTGLQLLGRLVNQLAGEHLHIGRVEGRLFTGWNAADIRFSDPAIRVRIDQLHWAWQPLALLRGTVAVEHARLDGVEIVLLDPPATAAAGQDAPPAGGLLPPLAVEVRQMVVDDFRLIGTGGKPLLLIDQLRADLRLDGDQLLINTFRLDGPDLGLGIAGTLQLGGAQQLQVSGDLRFAGYGFHPLAGSYSLSGPLAAPQVNLSLTQPGLIRVSGVIADLFGDPVWSARLHAEHVDLAGLIVHCPSIDLQRVDADMSGTFATYGGRVRASGAWEGFDRLELDAELHGDGQGIDFPTLSLRRDNGRAIADGAAINWRELFAWEGRFSFAAIDLSPILAELAGPVDAEFTSRGEVFEGGLAATFAVDHLSGTLLEYPLQAEGHILLSADGVETDGLRLESTGVPGSLSVERGHFLWGPELSWEAEVQLVDFQPGIFTPLVDGRINGLFHAAGSFPDDQPEVFLQIRQLSGSLAGNPLSGSGELRLRGTSLHAEELVLRSGATELSLSGDVDEELTLDFSLSSPDLGEIFSGSGGSLNLHGDLRGSRRQPRLTTSVSGFALWHGDARIGQIEAALAAGLGEGEPLSLSLAVVGVDVAGVTVDRGEVKVDGTLAAHQASMAVHGPPGRLALTATGGYAEEWRGAILAMELEPSGYGLWHQEGEAQLVAGRSGVGLTGFCLQVEDGRICSDGRVDFDQESAWQVQAAAETLPMGLLNRLGLVEPALFGRLEADLAITGRAQHLDTGSANLRLASFSMELPEEIDFEAQLRDIDLQLTLEDGRLAGALTSQVSGGGRLSLAAELMGVVEVSPLLLDLPLAGELEIEAFNAGLLAGFTGYEAVPAGLLSARLTLAGTPRRPMASGTLQFSEGTIGLPSLGIELADIDIDLVADRTEMQLRGRLASGPGAISAAGVVRYETGGVSAEMHLQGTDFLAVDLPEYRFRLSPDLHLLFSDERLEVRGLVEVPYGLVTPEEFRESIAPSADVVMVNGEVEEMPSARNISLHVNVRLGDEVRIDGHGLTGRLAGEINVQTTASDLLIGRGELDLVEGTFTIYGRSLDIARGRVLFTGGPIDNPGVDVRAQKSVGEDKARDRAYTVGVEISGLMQDLQFRLFSDPYMEDTEILSMMIVGHSFADSSQEEGSLLEAAALTLGMGGGSKIVEGVGGILRIDDLHLEGSGKDQDMSLVVGKRIFEDLYIGYDVNMFSQLGQFRVSYDLGRGFRVETRSSTESSGADLFYSFER